MIDWSLIIKFYAFPLFTIIEAVLKKIKWDKVLPHWPTQVWFPILEKWRSAKTLYSHPADTCYIYQPFPARFTLYTSTSLFWSASYPGTTELLQHVCNSNRHHNGVLALWYQQTIPDLPQMLGTVLPV